MFRGRGADGEQQVVEKAYRMQAKVDIRDRVLVQHTDQPGGQFVADAEAPTQVVNDAFWFR